MRTASNDLATGSHSEQGSESLMVQGADLFSHICRKQGGSPGIREYCISQNIIGALVAFLPHLPPRVGGAVSILRALCSLICAGPAAPEDCALVAEEAASAGFFGMCALHLRGWFEMALTGGGVQEACALVDCLGDLTAQLLQNDAARAEAVKGHFIPALFGVLTEQLLTEPLVWPRLLPVLMDSVEALPRPEYVRRGIDMSKALRKANPNQGTNMPSLLLLRMQGLKHNQPCRPSEPLRHPGSGQAGQFVRGRRTAKSYAVSDSCSVASSDSSSSTTIRSASCYAWRSTLNRTRTESDGTVLPPL